MKSVKLVVIYPRPKDVDAFEKMVATKVLGSPQGTPPFYRVAEVYFPSMQALEQCAASAGGQETLAHAAKISSGGPPIFLVAEEETFTFTKN
jgi:hypothetical protein